MSRSLLIAALLFISTPALAGKIAIVDFQRALAETKDGQAAQKRLEDGMSSRRAQLENQRQDLEKLYKDYESRKLILNDEARRAAEQDIVSRQRKLEADAYRFEQEMQQEYVEIVSDLDARMRELSAKIAKEKGYELVLDQTAVVYSGGETVDMTADLIRRYNGQ
ncbi:MAG: OmpH family outer membrane protein [Deltaproteobacteria bacterium]|nr:MAG: OmpH family outer membrane protein [Deltaproteobacteria bacterium]